MPQLQVLRSEAQNLVFMSDEVISMLLSTGVANHLVALMMLSLQQ